LAVVLVPDIELDLAGKEIEREEATTGVAHRARANRNEAGV